MLASLALLLVARPAPIRVALLPSVNVSGDKHARLVEEQAFEADRTMRKLLVERGFELVPAPTVRTAITEAKLDLSDEENFRKELLYDIGTRVQADHVAFAAVTSTMQKEKRQLFGQNLEGWATVRVWILNVPEKSPVVAGKPFSAASAKNASVGFGRQVRAVRFAVEGATKDGLKPFPVVVKNVKYERPEDVATDTDGR